MMAGTSLREALQQQIRAPLEPQLIYLAVKLGIPELLRDGAQSSTTLAQLAGVHAPSLHRVLRGMAVLGLVCEEADHRFSLTAKGALLQRAHPDTLADDALITGELLPAWGGLLRSVQTGEPAFDTVFGQGMFTYAAHHPELEQTFNRQMAGMTAAIADAVIQAYDFSGIAMVVDIGGGYGALLIRLLGAYPTMRGVLFDLPAVIASARERLAASSVGLRADCVPGDFFQAVPAGGDMYVLQVVIHDWDDAAAVRILTNCARAMRDDSRIVLIERLLPEKALEAPAVIQGDLNMLVLTGGCERTTDQYDRLLTAAGLELTQIVPTQSQWSLIAGKRRRIP
jgi:O-methyltransferase domain